jgi:cytoskeletal protein CcmA (bactofilin family)
MVTLFQSTPLSTKEETTCIGKCAVIRGELSAREDLIIEGKVEGKIVLKDHRLVIGKHGVIQGEIRARNVTVNGKVVGNIYAGELTEITATGTVEGNIESSRILVKDGAYFSGSVDLCSDASKEVPSYQEPAIVTSSQLTLAEVQTISV